VSDEQFNAIAQKTVEPLDPLDGVTDGMIDSPTQFRIDPEIFSCDHKYLNQSPTRTARHEGIAAHGAQSPKHPFGTMHILLLALYSVSFREVSGVYKNTTKFVY
jgi:hypothetical protein